MPLNLDAISPGCACEGWGLADAGSGLTGYANESEGDANITVDSFDAPSATEAISTVTIADAAITGYQMQIVQDYHPSPLSPNLFVNSVTVTNMGRIRSPTSGTAARWTGTSSQRPSASG